MKTKTQSNREPGETTPDGSPWFATAAECLKTLAHPVRLRMIKLLLADRYTVGELADNCKVADNVASEHLRLMQRCGLFDRVREGRRVYYQIAEPHLREIMGCIESRFLRG